MLDCQSRCPTLPGQAIGTLPKVGLTGFSLLGIEEDQRQDMAQLPIPSQDDSTETLVLFILDRGPGSSHWTKTEINASSQPGAKRTENKVLTRVGEPRGQTTRCPSSN